MKLKLPLFICIIVLAAVVQAQKADPASWKRYDKKVKIPATKDGRFVSMWMQLEYNFNLY